MAQYDLIPSNCDSVLEWCETHGVESAEVDIDWENLSDLVVVVLEHNSATTRATAVTNVLDLSEIDVELHDFDGPKPRRLFLINRVIVAGSNEAFADTIRIT